MNHHSHIHKETIAIIGTGWAGYALAHGLNLNRFCVIVVSPDTTSTLTPLLASVASGLFDFRLAQEPIWHKSCDLKYIKAYVTHVDFEEKMLRCRPAFSHLAMSESRGHEFQVQYDKVMIAPRKRINTFNIPASKNTPIS
jgi:NADH:ubiquinone reductase (non-electrogenic)